MSFTPMSIAGAWIYEPKVWPDERGTFHEVFRISAIRDQLGRDFNVQQVNQSLSNKGVIRGVHWTESESGQAKYVSCPAGALWDFIVDVRPESSTFGTWDAVLLTPENRKSVLISEGIGHGFLALKEGTIASYLCSAEIEPAADRAINPMSNSLAIDFEGAALGYGIQSFILSAKDASAPDF